MNFEEDEKMKKDKFKSLKNRKLIDYNLMFNSFALDYEKRIETSLLKKTKVSFKGLYPKAKRLWILGYELNIPPVDSIQHVLYFFLKSDLVKIKKIDREELETKKKAESRKKSFDRLLVSYVNRRYSKQLNKYEQDSNLPKPSMRDAFRAYQKKLIKMGEPPMSVDAIKEKYKRLMDEIFERHRHHYFWVKIPCKKDQTKIVIK